MYLLKVQTFGKTVNILAQKLPKGKKHGSQKSDFFLSRDQIIAVLRILISAVAQGLCQKSKCVIFQLLIQFHFITVSSIAQQKVWIL